MRQMIQQTIAASPSLPYETLNAEMLHLSELDLLSFVLTARGKGCSLFPGRSVYNVLLLQCCVITRLASPPSCLFSLITSSVSLFEPYDLEISSLFFSEMQNAGYSTVERLTQMNDYFIEQRKESITPAKTEWLFLAANQCEASAVISIVIVPTSRHHGCTNKLT